MLFLSLSPVTEIIDKDVKTSSPLPNRQITRKYLNIYFLFMQKPEGSHLFSANIIICELQQMDPTLIDLLRLHRDLNRKLSIMLNGAILIIHSKPIDPISPVYLSRHTLVRSLVRNAASPEQLCFRERVA